MTESTYPVEGMACANCAVLITAEIERIDGVSAVAVDVGKGSVTVTSDQDLDIAAVRGAVEEAGYDIARS